MPSAKEKGIPHIIPRALGAVTWSFLFGSVTVQSSDTVKEIFFNYYTTSPMSYWQRAGGIYITCLFSLMYFFFFNLLFCSVLRCL